ncbi:PPE domain-containing protein [Nocardia transvalensis]|uniref:PPE domain-containing protein n=1 Tax=Nocardia transvalensis TaxID=37333 RepID=UPI0018939323|nr:hypothetical protein [Nocardia transvalensis]MBF6327229.1 hypothetical protein [Nocardia transvalensis]
MHRVGGGSKSGPAQTDPDYAPNCEVFDHLDYGEIYRGVSQLNPEVISAGRQAWQSSATAVADAVQQAHAEIRGAMADGWRGNAAAMAAGAMQAFEELGQHLSEVMSVVGHRLGQANDAAEALRTALAEPLAMEPDLEGALLDPRRAAANVELQKAAEGMRSDAVRVMNSIYAGNFLPTGNNVPAFHDSGMYRNPVVVEGSPDPTAPGGGSADVMRPGAVVVPDAAPDAGQDESMRPATTPQEAGADDAGSGQPAAPVPADAPAATTAPAAAVTGPAAVAGTVPAPAPTADHAAVPGPSVAGSNIVAPQSGRVSVGTGPVATAAMRTQSASAGDGDGQRKREEPKDRRDHAADTVSGMGAGVVGGLAGGAFAAASDTTRPPTAKPVAPKRSHEFDEDDEYYPDLDEPTFLEPAEPGGDLVGRMDPTTPPVLGEWVEDD